MVIKNNKYGYIDKTGKIVIPLEYNDASDYLEGDTDWRQVAKNGEYFYINRQNECVLGCPDDDFCAKNGIKKAKK